MIRVGEVIAVNGVRVTIKVDEESSKDTIFYNGEKYKGISIREYIAIQRGFRNIICLVEGEHLDESRVEGSGPKTSYLRKVDARPIGHFSSNVFEHGIKYLPMIKDSAYLLSESMVAAIYGRSSTNGFVIGRTLKEGVPIGMPWAKLFNSHIGIFGNTGSGKSNTLAKLYTVLFEKKALAIGDRSSFVVFDFNGEYTALQLVPPELKAVYRLSTRAQGNDKFPVNEVEFWDAETLAILFQATTNTQKPFLTRLVDGRNRFPTLQSLTNYAKTTVKAAFCAVRPRPDSLDLLRKLAKIAGQDDLRNLLNEIVWHNGGSFAQRNSTSQYGYTFFNADGVEYDTRISPTVDLLDLSGMDAFEQLIARAYIQLTRELVQGFVQFDHIQPLIKRMEASLISLRKVLCVGDFDAPHKLVTVISFKHCNNEIKKVLPLLLAKHYFYVHRNSIDYPPNATLHLIIDEAHNILSHQSAREHESWRDYRLELFEEIVKEGRKFGVFLTVSSQRPADISQTIVSQLHNFFIHRLVNDRDLALIDNTITTLDALSKALIPNLSQGCCVVTGTAFDLPLILQIDALDLARKPDSEDVDLEALWSSL